MERRWPQAGDAPHEGLLRIDRKEGVQGIGLKAKGFGFRV